MKTTLVLIVLLILNTSALLSEPLAQLVSGIDSWMLITLEVLLFIILYVHHMTKGFNTFNQIELDAQDFYIFKSKEESQGES